MLELRQTQKLLPVLTQQLQQAIKLLQLSRLELSQAIEQEVQENPILEMSEERGADTSVSEDTGENEKDDIAELLERYSSSEEYVPRENGEYADYEGFVAASSNLRDHLRWQVGLADVAGDERIAAEWVIENIDDNGYLVCSVEEIADRSGLQRDVVDKALRKVQKLEPSGVGARDLKECILIQYEATGHRDPIFIDVVTSYFPLFEKNSLKEIAKKTGYGIDKIASVLEKIKTFDPKPGRNFTDDYASPVVPDVYVVKDKEGFVVTLNDDEIPELRLSRYYVDLYRAKQVNGETRRYIRGKIKQAQWFIKSIEQRQRTLFLVSTSIVNFQQEFLEKGLRFLKPLNLRDVAADVNMHESTISRVTSNKYMSTPQGLYEMKFFFPPALNQQGGDACSTNVVREFISEMVQKENKDRPLTDDEIVSLLRQDRGIAIARRTIVKYREMLHIPASRLRKISR